MTKCHPVTPLLDRNGCGPSRNEPNRLWGVVDLDPHRDSLGKSDP